MKVSEILISTQLETEDTIGTMDGGNRFVEGQKWVHRNIADALGDDDFEETHHEFQETYLLEAQGALRLKSAVEPKHKAKGKLVIY